MREPLSPVAVDTLIILSPPTRLTGWLTKVFAAKHVKGETVPPEFERWLERWLRIREGITTEVSVLTDDEWREIKSYLERKVPHDP